MKKYNLLITKFKDQRGVTAVVIAIAIMMILGFIALAVDIGYVAVAKNELQNVADASALAATGQLGAIYQPMTQDQIDGYVLVAADINSITNSVTDPSTGVGKKNKAAAEFVEVLAADVEIGRWKDPVLNPNGFAGTFTQPDAVRVTTRRDDSVSSGKIGMFFAKVLGFDSVPVKAQATAALSALSNVGPDGLPIPVGISRYWFDPNNWPPDGFCDQDIKFHPTGDLEGCAGWHTYDRATGGWPASASKLRDRLDGLRTGDFTSPPATAGDSLFVFTGGTVASAFDEMKALYDANKDVNGLWETTVVVYDRDDCSNPNKEMLIVGFATTVIREVLDSPEKTIQAKVICEDVEWGRGGGGDFGTLGTIPGLVQ